MIEINQWQHHKLYHKLLTSESSTQQNDAEGWKQFESITVYKKPYHFTKLRSKPNHIQTL